MDWMNFNFRLDLYLKLKFCKDTFEKEVFEMLLQTVLFKFSKVINLLSFTK